MGRGRAGGEKQKENQDGKERRRRGARTVHPGKGVDDVVELVHGGLQRLGRVGKLAGAILRPVGDCGSKQAQG